MRPRRLRGARAARGDAYNSHTPFSRRAMSKIEELADRVERLLLRHGELQRTNALLRAQLAEVAQDRDHLRARLTTARNRIDGLLERLPRDAGGGDSANASARGVS